MPVRKPLEIAAVFLLCITCLRAGPTQPDPHELYEAARDHLRNGDLESADQLLSRLRGLLAHGPQWDPDGVFANELLPPLLSRLRRMQAVTRKLDEFSARALRDLKPPEIADDVSTLRRYTDWATSVIRRLRDERDRIITTGLSNPDEQAALTLTASYARTERLLEIDVLRSLVDSTEVGALDLQAGDSSVDPMIVRFRQLKQNLMRTMMERDRLEQKAKNSRNCDETYLHALAALVTEGVLPAAKSGAEEPADVSALFGQYLDRELHAARRLATQTAAAREARRAAIGRFRRYNEVLARAGLRPDQSGRIEALARVVEGCPVEEGMLATSSAARWAHALLTGVLALIAGFATWLAMVRGRRLSTARGPDEPTASVIEGAFRRSDVDGNAA